MKKFLLLALFGLFSLTFGGCEEPEMKINSIEEKETFDAFLTVNISYEPESSGNEAKNPGFETADPYNVVFPSTFKAYFVSNETTGEFLKGQLVKTVDVTEGTNKIDSLPKMSYTVYVTNYDNSDDTEWYTKQNALNLLPPMSHEMYVHGKSVVNYNELANGTVNIKNTYACVQILKSEYVIFAMAVYGTEDKEILYFDGNNDWYVIYQRENSTALSYVIVYKGDGSQNTYHLPLNNIPISPNTNVWVAHHKRGGKDGFDHIAYKLNRRE